MKQYHYPVAFTGAGISVASGLPMFNTLWRGVPIRDLLTREYFHQDPVGFYEMAKELETWTEKEPNQAHLAIARAGIPVVTQNIDGLHQKAGSRVVWEIHGNLREMVCLRCGQVWAWKPLNEELPFCDCGQVLKPRVVLFGDDLLNWDEAMAEMLRADLVLVIGSSLAVAPACYLPQMARANGAKLITINERAEVELPLLIAELDLSETE